MPASKLSVINGTCTDVPQTSTLDWDCCRGGLIVNPQPFLPRNGGMLILWILLLGWVFMGVAMGADAFMTSIERITSSTKLTTVTIRGEKKRFHTRVWNDTVANLTLMALGSSAPEILLAVIEIVMLSPRGAFYAGDLGPSTIIGSAAFNLMVICGVCIIGIPNGEVRTLKHLTVFMVTASFSIFAYLWMVIVLVLWTPNLVSITEAVLTLLFMGILVAIAYAADSGMLSASGVTYASKGLKILQIKKATSSKDGLAPGSPEAKGKHGVPELTPAEVAKYLKHLADTGQIEADSSDAAPPTDVEAAAPVKEPQNELDLLGVGQKVEAGGTELSAEQAALHAAAKAGLTPEQIAKGIQDQYEEPRPRTKTEIRAEALKGMTGGFSMKNKFGMGGGKSSEALTEKSGSQKGGGASDVGGISLEETKRCTFVGFATSIVTVTEGDDAFAVLTVMRNGCLDDVLTVRYETRAGTATAGEDFTPVDGTLTFASGVTSQTISVPILDDDEIEDDEEFYVALSSPKMTSSRASENEDDAPPQSPVRPRVAGPKLHAECTVCIKDDDVLPGTLQWKQSEYKCVESDGFVTLTVERRRGHNGEVSVKYDTKTKQAIEDVDYVGAHGTLTFAHGVMSQTVTIKIIDDTAYEKDETFLCILSEPEGGAIFRDDTDGREDSDICTITIESDGGVRTKIDRVMQLLNLDRQKQEVLCSAWKDQLAAALVLPADERTPKSVFMHVLMLPWKLLFGLCPPSDMAGGWALFFGALLGILLQVILIGDLASQLGCQVGLSDGVTAITVVALGTSLPDLFASMQAAREDPTADNSVGNVTGSNSVNVFLGLGLPFVMATIYWSARGATPEWIGHYPNLHANSYPDGGFIMCAGSLAFNVTVFLGTAILTLASILARRFCLSPAQELGGDRIKAWATFSWFIFLYLIYLTFSILRLENVVPSFAGYMDSYTSNSRGPLGTGDDCA